MPHISSCAFKTTQAAPGTHTAGCSTQASPVLTSCRRRRRTHSGWQDRALLWASAASSFTRYVYRLCFWPARLYKACATCQLPRPRTFIAPQIRHWRELTEPLTTEDRDAIKRVRGIALVSNLWGSLFSAQLTEVGTLKQHYFTQDLERCVQAATGLDGWVLTLVGGARQGKVGGVSGCDLLVQRDGWQRARSDKRLRPPSDLCAHATRIPTRLPSTTQTSCFTVSERRASCCRQSRSPQEPSRSFTRCTTTWSTRVSCAASCNLHSISLLIKKPASIPRTKHFNNLPTIRTHTPV